MRWDLVACLICAWILVYFAIWKSIKSSGKVRYFTATLPFVLIIIFLGRAVTLDGSQYGLRFVSNHFDYISKQSLAQMINHQYHAGISSGRIGQCWAMQTFGLMQPPKISIHSALHLAQWFRLPATTNTTTIFCMIRWLCHLWMRSRACWWVYLHSQLSGTLHSSKMPAWRMWSMMVSRADPFVCYFDCDKIEIVIIRIRATNRRYT